MVGPVLRGRWTPSARRRRPAEAFVREFVATGELESAVSLLGGIEHSDLLQRLADAHVVVLPSIWPENQPVSLLEGIVAGAAVIATCRPGQRRACRAWRNGLLCAAGDSAALAAAMRELIVSPTLMEKFSQENLRRRAAYDEQARPRRPAQRNFPNSQATTTNRRGRPRLRI